MGELRSGYKGGAKKLEMWGELRRRGEGGAKEGGIKRIVELCGWG